MICGMMRCLRWQTEAHGHHYHQTLAIQIQYSSHSLLCLAGIQSDSNSTPGQGVTIKPFLTLPKIKSQFNTSSYLLV